MFLSLISINYLTNQNLLQHSINKYKHDTLSFVQISVSKWLEEKIDQIESIRGSIHLLDHKKEKNIIKHITERYTDILGFSSIYLGYKDKT